MSVGEGKASTEENKVDRFINYTEQTLKVLHDKKVKHSDHVRNLKRYVKKVGEEFDVYFQQNPLPVPAEMLKEKLDDLQTQINFFELYSIVYRDETKNGVDRYNNPNYQKMMKRKRQIKKRLRGIRSILPYFRVI